MRQAYWKGGLVAVGVSAGIVVSALAAPAMSTHADRTARAVPADTLTGCLKKGEEKGEYAITAKNGKTYGLRSSKVSLGGHLGHTVTVVGTPVKEKEDEDEKAESKGASTEAGDLSVTSLKMVSATCQ
jgi:hypothetical protein